MELFYLILLLTLSVILGIVTNGKLYDDKIKGRFTTRGYLALGLFVIIVALTGLQNDLEERKEIRTRKTADSTLNAETAKIRNDYAASVKEITQSLSSEYETRSKDLKHSYDSSTQDIVVSLAQYNLKYDSARKTIERIVGKSSGIPDPEFSYCDIDPIKIIDTSSESFNFEIRFCSSKSPAYNIRVNNYLVLHEDRGPYKYSGTFNLIPNGLYLKTESGTGVPITIYNPLYSGQRLYRHMFIISKGTFTNYDGSKIYPIDDITVFDFNTRTVGGATYYFDQKVRETLKANGIL